MSAPIRLLAPVGTVTAWEKRPATTVRLIACAGVGETANTALKECVMGSAIPTKRLRPALTVCRPSAAATDGAITAKLSRIAQGIVTSPNPFAGMDCAMVKKTAVNAPWTVDRH